MIEPNCDMPWEIYLDWLADQGHDKLREINQFDLCCLGESMIYEIPENYGCGITGCTGILSSEYMGIPAIYYYQHFVFENLSQWLASGMGSVSGLGNGNVPGLVNLVEGN